jgi:hypothetical protein
MVSTELDLAKVAVHVLAVDGGQNPLKSGDM